MTAHTPGPWDCFSHAPWSIDHLDRLGRDVKRYGGTIPHGISAAKQDLDSLYLRMVRASAVTITPDV